MANHSDQVAWVQPLAGDGGSGESNPAQAVPPRRQRVLRALELRLGLALEEAAFAQSPGGLADVSTLLPQLGRLCAADSMRLFLFEDDRLSCVAQLRADTASGMASDDDLPEREIELAVAAGRPAIVEPAIRYLAAVPRPSSWLVLPLAGGGVKHGALVLERRELFSGEDLTVMTVYTALLGERMTSAAREVHLDRQQRELEQHLFSQRRLLEINERLLSNVDPAGVLDLIADSLKSLVVYDNLTIFRVDAEAAVLRPVLVRDRFAALILGITLPIDLGITGSVLALGAAECVNDAHLDPRANLIAGTPMEAESLVVVPLRVGGQVVGTLNVGRMGEEGHFSANEFELVKLLGGQASIAIANVEAHRALWARAETDALTGLRNRGSFEQDLERALDDHGLSSVLLLMIDLDDFKLYNDRHGHLAGDQVLRHVGSAIVAATCSGRAPALRGLAGYRYGGDEFAVIVPDGKMADASAIRQRLAAALGSILSPGEAPLTASVGAAMFPEAASTRDALVAAADAEMYRAKARTADQPTAGPRSN